MKNKIALATATATAAVATLMLAAAAPSHAQWYVGASVGKSDITFNNATQSEQFLDLGYLDPVTTSRNRDTGYRLFGGYQLHKNVALEAAYVDLGKFGFRTDVSPAGSLIASTRISGFELSALGLLPLNERFTLFARIGALAGDTKTSYAGSGSVEALLGGETQSKRSTQLSYGAGATFAINNRLAVRGEWSKYTQLGNEFTGGKTDANLYSLGLTYRF
jgi:OmpA-OmpF porin, OOP family